MSATLLARVRRVVIGHDGRALVHAVEDSGREHKLEVPAELVRETTASGGRHVLLLAWSLHELPDVGEAVTTMPAASMTSDATPTADTTATTPTAAPSTVDADFMALLGRRAAPPPEAGSAAAPTASPSTATRGPELPLAALLGLVPGAAPS